MKRIMLVCSEGMSTGFLVSKMKTEADKQGFECTIDSCCEADLDLYKDKVDVLLLAPQVKFLKNTISEKFNNIPVEIISSIDYGTMNGVKVLNEILKLLKEDK